MDTCTLTSGTPLVEVLGRGYACIHPTHFNNSDSRAGRDNFCAGAYGIATILGQQFTNPFSDGEHTTSNKEQGTFNFIPPR
jgi:hypothetical protein